MIIVKKKMDIDSQTYQLISKVNIHVMLTGKAVGKVLREDQLIMSSPLPNAALNLLISTRFILTEHKNVWNSLKY